MRAQPQEHQAALPTNRGARPTGQCRRHEPAEFGEISERADAVMHPSQTAKVGVDLAPRHAEEQELPSRYDVVLPSREVVNSSQGVVHYEF
jgi:hypothetical protein